MDKAIELKDFDVLGIIRLKNVEGIEKYVTPIFDVNGNVKEYLSRSKEYYNVKSMSELSGEREFLKRQLTREISRRNYVILENMLNCSAKVYFKKLENYIISKKDERLVGELKQAETCILEDTRNILVILEQKGLINLDKQNILPSGEENAEKRFIEMDNKSLLYIFAKSLNPETIGENIEVVLPGYGGLYIGPFLKEMYGYNYTNVLKSKYIEDTSQLAENIDIQDKASNRRPFEEGKTLLILDDNVGTGQTMLELKKEFQNCGIQNIMTGAVMFNWRNFYRVSVGEKKDIERFEPEQFDLLTPINYGGNKLYKHAVDQLHSSGNCYIEYLKTKGYQKENVTDLRGQIERGILCAKKCGLELMSGYNCRLVTNSYPKKEMIEKYKEKSIKISGQLSINLIDSIMDNLEVIEESKENDFSSKILK